MSISAEIIPICALQDNYIWMIKDSSTKKAWIVDPGEATPVFKTLNQFNLQLSGILITHHHRDHTGGVKDLLHQYNSIPVYGSYRSSLAFITHHIREGDEINCGNITFKAIEIPGHTLDHTAYFGNNVLFSGDTLFSMGCGKIFEGTPEQMYHSLKKLSALPSQTRVFCGHEYTLVNLHFLQHIESQNTLIDKKLREINQLLAQHRSTLPSTMEEENRLNPFLRCEESNIKIAVEQYAQKTFNTPIEIFAKLREWKNHYI